MRRRLMALVACALAACTSTTEVMVSPDQVRAFAGIQQGEERQLIADRTGEAFVVTGDDEARLLVRPGDFPGTRGRPWVRLSDLRWYPPMKPTATTGVWLYPDDQIGVRFYPVRASDLAGADVRVREPDPALTVLLVAGIVVVVAGVAFGALAVVAYEINNHPP